MSRRILLVEDDGDTADYILKGLRQDGFTVEHVVDGRDGLYMATRSNFDAVILDRMLPGLDGLAVIKAMRAAEIETPVLFLSALGHLDERVKGLRAGGDDYLTKPFAFTELLARLENILRRRTVREVITELQCDDLTMDLLSRRVTRAGVSIELLPREFKLLEYLLRHCGRVVTRTMLLEQVWDYRFDPHTSVVDTHISRLRKKIDEGYSKPLLKTLRGTGFRLSADP